MNATLELMQKTAFRICREKLSSDERYCRLREESTEGWEQFKSAYPGEIADQVLDLLDTDYNIDTIEAELLFLLGLQMGLELGSLDLLDEG